MHSKKVSESRFRYTTPLGSCSTRIHWDSYDMGLWDGLKVFSKIVLWFFSRMKRGDTCCWRSVFFFSGWPFFMCGSGEKDRQHKRCFTGTLLWHGGIRTTADFVGCYTRTYNVIPKTRIFTSKYFSMSVRNYHTPQSCLLKAAI